MLLECISEAERSGLPLIQICRVLKIDRRRIQRWRNSDSLDRKTTVRTSKPYNAMISEETEILDNLIASKELADASCRVLSIKAMELHETHISHVTVWNALKAKNINGPRGIYANRKNKHTKPDIGDITGPNQLWSWDITHVKTTTKYMHYYLYVLLDWYSRKAVAWHLSESLCSDAALTLWDKGLINEKLEPQAYPKSLSDRGTQMRAISTKMFFKSLGVKQLFSRPRTPNDNPQIESFFSTLKNTPQYPGRFKTLEQASEYFNEFFHWYNYEHYHTGIGMVSPNDRHTGNDIHIFKKRAAIKEATMLKRRQQHCNI